MIGEEAGTPGAFPDCCDADGGQQCELRGRGNPGVRERGDAAARVALGLAARKGPDFSEARHPVGRASEAISKTATDFEDRDRQGCADSALGRNRVGIESLRWVGQEAGKVLLVRDCGCGGADRRSGSAGAATQLGITFVSDPTDREGNELICGGKGKDTLRGGEEKDQALLPDGQGHAQGRCRQGQAGPIRKPPPLARNDL
jgi:hypothetical protein